MRFSESSLSRQLEDENEELRKELSNEKMRVAQTEWFATDEVLKKQWELYGSADFSMVFKF